MLGQRMEPGNSCRSAGWVSQILLDAVLIHQTTALRPADNINTAMAIRTPRRCENQIFFSHSKDLFFKGAVFTNAA